MAEVRSRPSLLLSCSQGDELDLLAAQLDLELFAGLEAQLDGVGLADESDITFKHLLLVI